jgi:hypothetical protein
LSRLGIGGPFDFVLDIGCFHGLPAHSRQAYAREVARVSRPEALFMLWAIGSSRRPLLPGVPVMHDKEIAERFGQDFILERVEHGEGRWPANWYTLRRREGHADQTEGECVQEGRRRQVSWKARPSKRRLRKGGQPNVVER